MAPVTVTYQLKPTRCNKPQCRCNTADQSQWHGPYWYAFWHDPKTDKTRSRYVGKNFTPPKPGSGPNSRARSQQGAEPPPGPPPREGAKKKTAGGGKRRTPPGGEQRRPPPGGERRHAPPPPRGDQDSRDAELLGVDLAVTQDALKKAWRRKIAAVHPDRYQGAERAKQEEAAKAINAAYDRMRRRRGWK